MPDLKDNAETIGAIWDSLNSAKKFRLVALALGLVIATGSAGFWLGTLSGASRIAAQEAKHERDLTEHDRQRLDQIKDLRRRLEDHAWPKEAGIPDVPDAEAIGTSQESFLNEYFRARDSEKADKTTIKLDEFFRKYQGRAVHWSGYVWDVSDAFNLVCVTMALPQGQQLADTSDELLVYRRRGAELPPP
jgi:hypothetical protein